MKNVTVTLDPEVALWARVRAAERNTSVSRLVGEMLREQMLQEDRYHQSEESYLALPATLLRPPGARYPGREELHDRPGLR